MTVTAHPLQPSRPGQLDDIPGWFFPNDRLVFDWVLHRQQREDVRGDLLEMGAYLGKSTVMLGHFRRPEETLTVCDLFDSDAPDDANGAEMAMSYRSTLTRESFESNYLAFHQELPEIIQAPTSVLADGRIAAGSCRFVHVDASHLYDHVAGDIQVAKDALSADGVLALDDFRAEHTPGVAAAVWGAVLNHGMRPVCLTTNKFYGTWGDPEPLQESLLATVPEWAGHRTEIQSVAGHRVIRVIGKSGTLPEFPLSRYHHEVEAERAARAEAQRAEQAALGRRPSALLKRTAKQLLPPVVTQAVVRSRRPTG
jgi:hypothetical protein